MFAADRPLPPEREKMDFNTLPNFNLNPSVLQQNRWSGLGGDHRDHKVQPFYPKNREKEIRSFLGLQRQVPSQARPQEPGVEGPQGRAGVLEEREIDFESGFWRSVR